MGKVGCDIWEKWVKSNTSLHARIKVRRLRVHFGLDMLRKGPSCDALASISEKTISSSEMSCESKMSSMSANAVLYSVTPKQNKR